MPNYLLEGVNSKGATINFGNVANEINGNPAVVDLKLSFDLSEGLDAELVGELTDGDYIYKIGSMKISALAEGYILYDVPPYFNSDALDYTAISADADSVEFFIAIKRTSGGN